MAIIPEDKLNELLDCFDSIVMVMGIWKRAKFRKALAIVGFKKPNYEIDDIMEEFDVKNNDGKIDFQEFKMLYSNLLEKDFGSLLRNSLRSVKDAEDYGSRCSQGSYDTKHSIRKEEQTAFADWINRNLEKDMQCANYLPFHPEGRDLFSKCRDGIILCKILNKAIPDTVDERAINYGTNLSLYKKLENCTLALNSARAVGCNVVNIGASDIERGIEHLTLGLLWQIIKVALLNSININEHSEIAVLSIENESLADIRGLSPEDILIRWVNFHLEKAGVFKRIHNFTDDIKDSEAYAYLLSEIAPKDASSRLLSPNNVMEEVELTNRAEMILKNADILKARNFVTSNDIAHGNEKIKSGLCRFIVSSLSSSEKGDEIGDLDNHGIHSLDIDIALPEETSEEKMYRNWINSLGLNRRVYYLYKDLQDSLIIFQLYDIIKPDSVNWTKVNETFTKLKKRFQLLENANYAVALGIENKFSLVGIQGDDIVEGNETLTLALLWQLLRAYNLCVLNKIGAAAGKEIDESDILHWVNNKLGSKSQVNRNGRSNTSTPIGTAHRQRLISSCSNQLNNNAGFISGFNDQKLRDGRIIIQLIETIRPRTVDEKMITDDNIANAKYAISMARKIGARVYAQPEDIVELKGKMIMTLLASLMVTDYQKQRKK